MLLTDLGDQRVDHGIPPVNIPGIGRNRGTVYLIQLKFNSTKGVMNASSHGR